MGMAYGGTPGDDGRRQYGIGSWFQKKIMDPIKSGLKSPLGKAAAVAALGYGLNQYGIPGTMGKMGADPTKRIGQDWFTNLNLFNRSPVDKTNPAEMRGNEMNPPGGLGKFLMNPNFLIPAASLFSGAFAKQDEPGYTGQGTGLNLQDIGRVANITDPKTAMAAGLRFSPDVETRKFTPEEMLQSYATTAAEEFSTPSKA